MRHSLALILLLSLIGCGGSSHTLKEGLDLDAKPRPAEEMYAEAKKELDDKNYEKAGKLFESLQTQYPYGRYAQQAQMEMAYAYYKQNEPESALSAIDRFIKQYPSSAHLDYIYYLKGVVHFDAHTSIFAGIFPQNPSQHDPRSAQESFDAFKELVTRFPNSKYAPDATVRMQYLVNLLARHEVDVASYYLQRGAYVAAVNRAKIVLSDYPQSPLTRDALQVMVQAYNALGMTDLRDDVQRVLDRNSKDAAAKPAALPTIAPAASGVAPAQTTKP